MDPIFRVDAVYANRLVRSFLVRGVASAEEAQAKVEALAYREAVDGEPLYPDDCMLSIAPVEFEIGGIEAL